MPPTDSKGIDPTAPCVNLARGIIDEVAGECSVVRDRSGGFTYVKGDFPLSDFRFRPTNPDTIASSDPRHYYLKDVYVMV